MTKIQDILNNIGKSKFAKTGRSFGGVTSGDRKNKKVYVFDSNGIQVEILKSTSCAIKKYGSMIGHRVKTGLPTKDGLFFSYENEYKPKTRRFKYCAKPVLQYQNDKFIAEYPSIYEASIKLKINESNIGLCARGKRKSAGGFVFKFK